jgi:parvulin-like peptidyl-prolyl isomerase
MEKKFNEYGLSLTAEDEKKIDADTEADIKFMKEIYQSMVQMSDETLTEEQIITYGEQQYNAMLEYCGLTKNDIRNWYRSNVIQTKLVEYVSQQNPYDYANSEAQAEIIENNAKTAYAEDPSTLNPDVMKMLWLPEGSRAVKHILIGFDEVTYNEIASLRSAGKNDDADALIEEKLPQLSEKLKQVQDKLAAGQDFDALIEEYSDSQNGAELFYAAPGSTSSYGMAFAKAAMEIPSIGETAVCATDYGYHVICYVDDATVSPETRKEYVDAIHVYLESSYHAEKFDEALTEWRSGYKYTIDRDALILLDEE